MTNSKTNTSPQWSKKDEQGVRSFLPYGNAKSVRMVLKNKDGEIVDRCGVTNVEADIRDTFNELVKHHKGDVFTYELSEK
jgi:hypothetical protein